MKESEKYDCIKQFRKKTGLPILECRDIVERNNYDIEKALDPYIERPYEEEYEEETDNVPFCSKEKTDDHIIGITCPHCEKEFYCRGFGGAG